jgi:DNA-binding NarL/FixJ family response regulator
VAATACAPQSARPILVVDDDPAFRTVVVELLTRAGFASTVEVSTGRDALDAARADPPALVLLDVLLPDLCGFEVCRTLRDEFGEGLPILFVSGRRVDPADRAAGLLIGGDDYLVKPVFPDEFLARVRRAIQRAWPEPAADSPALDLTPRELEVLELLARGGTQPEIAAELVISPRTVASHVQRILAKLDVHSRAQAVAAAYRLGLIES